MGAGGSRGETGSEPEPQRPHHVDGPGADVGTEPHALFPLRRGQDALGPPRSDRVGELPQAAGDRRHGPGTAPQPPEDGDVVVERPGQ